MDINGEENILLNQRIRNLEKEVIEIKKELNKKENRPDKTKKYISWLIAAIVIIGFYSFYYFYIMSIF